MYSPKRLKLNNMSNGGYSKKRDENDEIEEEAAMNKALLENDGVSPYFLGKPRRKKLSDKPPNSTFHGRPPSFNMRESTEEEEEEIVIEEDEVVDSTPEREKEKEQLQSSKPSAQRTIKPFLFTSNPKERPPKNPKKQPEMSFTSERGEVAAATVLSSTFDRKRPEHTPTASSSSLNGKRQPRNFHFDDDPSVREIRNKIMDICDPTGEQRKSSPEFLKRMQEKTVKSIELASEPHRKKRNQKTVTSATLGTIYPSFTTASGQDVHKNKFVNPLAEIERVAKYKIVDCSRQSSASSSVGVPIVTRKPSYTAPFVKKAMRMDTHGGGKDEQLTGLKAEPTLRNFDDNIINLIESEIMSVNNEIGWVDVAGLEGAKKALREIVVLPFKRPDVFTGIRAPPKGVLLFGPPGTGKTMIGRCVASQCKATFFNISASSLTSKWVGEGEKLVRALFAVARLKLPSVIFIDEVDSLLSSRSESEHESSRRIKTEFLVQLDGVNTAPDERLLVLGATNRPQELDEAARRRFQKRLYIALPEPESRTQIVKNLLKGTRNDIEERNLRRISDITVGYSGADMRQLCTEAAMGPIRDVGDDIETIDKDDIRAVNLRDFVEAAQVVRPTVDDSQLDAYASWDKKFGCLPPSR